MPTAPDKHNAHNYAERIRERLPRRLQELREACGRSKYGLARKSASVANTSAKSTTKLPAVADADALRQAG
jgi:hypothetical protein